MTFTSDSSKDRTCPEVGNAADKRVAARNRAVDSQWESMVLSVLRILRTEEIDELAYQG